MFVVIKGVIIMKFESKEISEYVKSTIEGIEKGLPKGYELKGEIEFELVIVNTKEGEGGIKIQVVSLGGNKSKEDTSKIKFKVGKKHEFVLV